MSYIKINRTIKHILKKFNNPHGYVSITKRITLCNRCFLTNIYTVRTFEEGVLAGYNYKSTSWLIIDNENMLTKIKYNHTN